MHIILHREKTDDNVPEEKALLFANICISKVESYSEANRQLTLYCIQVWLFLLLLH